MQKIFLPTLCAIIIAGGVFWLVAHHSQRNTTSQNDGLTIAVSTDQNQIQNPNQPVQVETNPNGTTSSNPQKIMNATIHTNKGDFTIEFNRDLAPNAVANFVKLAQSGFYDGTKFHRVIKGFMDQGGDPLSKDDSQSARWGTGGPGYQFPDEITPNSKNDAGTIAMANSGPNTNGSQFFVNAVANNFLDGKYVVFGKVTAGMDIVIAINGVPTQNDRPLNSIVIESITLH